jgi:hypothetical protein
MIIAQLCINCDEIPIYLTYIAFLPFIISLPIRSKHNGVSHYESMANTASSDLCGKNLDLPLLPIYDSPHPQREV